MNSLRVMSADPLADLTDEDVLRLQESVPPTPAGQLEPWWEDFKYDLYDWDDPEFIRKNKGRLAYMPIRLTQGYFMMVHPSRYKEMTQFPDGKQMSWHAHVRYQDGRIVGVYALRKGRLDYDEVTSVLAHRQLLGIVNDSSSIVGEHINRRGLDNRCLKGEMGKENPINLLVTGKDENGHNAVRARKDDLPPGVERTGTLGNYRYNGKVCVRRGKTKVVTIRSRKWKTPEPAARWYQNYLKRKCKRTMWARRPETVNMPFFPPLKPEYRKVFVQTEKAGPALELVETF